MQIICSRNTLSRQKTNNRDLAIERERFPDRLHVTCAIPEDLLSLQVPILLLQPLVENAVRHGTAVGCTAAAVY